jgi:hypothetical protein
MLVFAEAEDIFSIRCNYTFFNTFFLYLKNENKSKINGLHFWVVFYKAHPVYNYLN